MKEAREDKLEKRIRFVAKHYREDALDENRAWKRMAERKGIKRKSILLSYYRQAIAAVILVCLTLSTWYYMTSEREEWIVVVTAAGQKKNVFLPDSSMVAMAGSSTIRYELNGFKKGNRAVEMGGKAFFQVRKMSDSPFSVATESAVVTVLGTSFQLDEKDGETELFVNTGKVAFAAKVGNEELILTAGMSAVYRDGEDLPVALEEENKNALSWHTKELHFDNTPLKRVMRDLSDHYQVKITNRMKEEDKRLTATFNDLSLEETLLVINQTLDTHLVVDSGK